MLAKIFTKIVSNRFFFNKNNLFKSDANLILNVILICLIGFIEIYSATLNDDRTLFIKQIFLFCVASVICFIAIPAISIKFIVKNSYIFYAGAVFLLLLIFIIGDVSMGARRWINIFGFKLQPSEIIKTFLILAIARYLHFTKIDDIGRLSTYPVVFGFILLPAALTILQPDLGTAVIIILIGFGMIFISGIKYAYVAIVFGVGLLSLPIVWMNMHDYQKNRVLVFMNPALDPLGSGYNITQSKIAIGSGGLFGSGYLQGKQSQLNFLPEKHTDFIFTHFCEEFGMVGVVVLLVLYSALFFNMYSIVIRADSHFIRLACAGIMFDIFLHVFINIAMTIGLVPVVGVPLPFMSYGGTFLIVNLINIGLVLNFFVNKDVSIQTSTKLL